MQLTIIPSDNAVYIDGVVKLNLDLSVANIPANVHALQWFDTKGWIEFSRNDPFSEKPDNEQITELPQWANLCVNVWNND